MERKAWKENHVCSINFTGSAGAVEPFGTLAIFQRSVGYDLRYKCLISDGDSKTFALLGRQQVYGTDPERNLTVLAMYKEVGDSTKKLESEIQGTENQ